MKRKFLLLTLLIASLSIAGMSQDPVILTVNQPEPLLAEAGEDAQIASGESATLGGNPSAAQGYEGYIYLWSPAEGLDDPTLPNPVASPDHTITYMLTVTDANNCSATDEVTITVGTSGIDNISSLMELRCYPNPVSDELRVEFSGPLSTVKLNLISPLGKILKTRNLDSAGLMETLSISMRDLPAGIYFLQAVTDERTIIQSIIKTR